MEHGTKGGWKETTSKIETTTTGNILTTFKNKIEEKATGKTKSTFLLNHTQWEPGKRKNYLNTLKRTEASIIFKARTRMLDIKENYRGKYTDNKCRLCKDEVETQEHILENCRIIHNNETTKITTTEIFDEDIEILISTVTKINNIMRQLDQVELPPKRSSDLDTQRNTPID